MATKLNTTPLVKPSTNNTTLDDLIDAAEGLYGSYDITDYNVKLRPLLRLTKAERKELTEVTSQEPDENGDTMDYLDILRAWVMIVADNKVGAEKLIESVGDRLDVFRVLQDRWQEMSQSGGSLALGELIDQHGAALYSDLLAVYGVDLIEVIAGRAPHTPRVLMGLIEHLPEGCAFPAALAGRPEGRFWTSQIAVSAAVHNAMQVNTMVVGNIRKRDRKAFAFIEPPWEQQPVDRTGKSGARKAFELLGGEYTPVPDELRATA